MTIRLLEQARTRTRQGSGRVQTPESRACSLLTAVQLAAHCCTIALAIPKSAEIDARKLWPSKKKRTVVTASRRILRRACLSRR